MTLHRLATGLLLRHRPSVSLPGVKLLPKTTARPKSGPYGYTQAKSLVFSKYGEPNDVLRLFAATPGAEKHTANQTAGFTRTRYHRQSRRPQC